MTPGLPLLSKHPRVPPVFPPNAPPVPLKALFPDSAPCPHQTPHFPQAFPTIPQFSPPLHRTPRHLTLHHPLPPARPTTSPPAPSSHRLNLSPPPRPPNSPQPHSSLPLPTLIPTPTSPKLLPPARPLPCNPTPPQINPNSYPLPRPLRSTSCLPAFPTPTSPSNSHSTAKLSTTGALITHPLKPPSTQPATNSSSSPRTVTAHYSPPLSTPLPSRSQTPTRQPPIAPLAHSSPSPASVTTSFHLRLPRDINPGHLLLWILQAALNLPRNATRHAIPRSPPHALSHTPHYPSPPSTTRPLSLPPSDLLNFPLICLPF